MAKDKTIKPAVTKGNLLQKLLDASGCKYASIAANGILSDISGYLDTGCYMFNAVLSGSLYGGIPNNRVTVVAGKSQVGKSYFIKTFIRSFLRDNPTGIVFLFDSEFAYTKEDLEAMGIDTTRIIVIPVPTIEEFNRVSLNLINAYEESSDPTPIMMALDSVGQLASNKEVADTAEGNDKRDMTKQAKLKGAFRTLLLKLGHNKIPLIIAAHTYNQIGAYVPTEVVAGGEGLIYAATSIILMRASKDKDAENNPIGVKITCNVEKSRLTKKWAKAVVLLNFKTGILPYSGLLEFGEESGIIERVGNRYKFPNGELAFEKAIQTSPETYFTKDVLDLLDEQAKKTFPLGKGDDKVTVDELLAGIDSGVVDGGIKIESDADTHPEENADV